MRRIGLLSLICLMLLTSCGTRPVEQTSGLTAVCFTDDLGREVSVSNPSRVVALIGSFADVWCLAGGQETLMAAAHDAWTSFDLELGEGVADLEAIKEPNMEVLLAAEPDLILASYNTVANLELRSTFEQLGIPAAYFDIQTFEDYLRMLEICTMVIELSGGQRQKSIWPWHWRRIRKRF